MRPPPFSPQRDAVRIAVPNGDVSPMNKFPAIRRALSTRRLILLATVANLGVAALVLGTEVSPQSLLPTVATAQAAEAAQRPVGFGDLVEKVKPAVISVRVKIDSPKMMGFDGNGPSGQIPEMRQFFRRFGMPDGGNMPNAERAPHNRQVTGQGSGFFITADGYAVTNNHVVDKAQTVEITTDDGKTYSAKVIGTDERTDIAVIKVDGRSDFPFVKLADKAPRIGDWVLAVGNPFGLGV